MRTPTLAAENDRQMSEPLCIGIDFGTDSVRVVAIRADTGAQEARAVEAYPRWSQGRYCDAAANRFRQHPLDYIESLERACRAVSAHLSGAQRDSIIGIGIDATASTVAAVDEAGTPLSLGERFADNPNAMFVLWKDHTAMREADEINALARTWGGIDFTCYSGGVYSSEWFWAKALHVLRADPQVAAAAYSWTEHCDWIPGLLTGATAPGQLRRGRAAAGHKAMWHASWGGLPGADFLARLDPRLGDLRGRLYADSSTADQSAGALTAEWARRLALPAGTTVAVGGCDAHFGAVGGGVRPGTVAKILGTSTCDMIVADPGAIGERTIDGICGQVDGSIVPGLIGLEAGQSAYGDVYAWFRDLLCWPLRSLAAERRAAVADRLLDDLSDAAAALPVDPAGILSLDWFNGRRTPNADAGLKAAITGLSLGADAPAVYRSLVEATAYGSRAINEHLVAAGIPVDEIIALGGISQRSDFAVQVAADVLGMPIKVSATEEGPALGATMCAATAAGHYATVQEAQAAMAPGFKTTYEPDRGRATQYTEGYQRYRALAEAVESAPWRPAAP